MGALLGPDPHPPYLPVTPVTRLIKITVPCSCANIPASQLYDIGLALAQNLLTPNCPNYKQLGAQRGTISGAGGLGSLIRKNLGGEFSVFRKVRSELLQLGNHVQHSLKFIQGDT